jgi:hypothetical protein
MATMGRLLTFYLPAKDSADLPPAANMRSLYCRSHLPTLEDPTHETQVISVWINGQQRDDIDEGWIAQRIQGLRHEGESVCVQVTVKGDGVDLR